MCRMKLVVQQSIVKAVKPIDIATEAAEEAALRRRRQRSSSNTNTHDAVAAFTQLLDQASFPTHDWEL